MPQFAEFPNKALLANCPAKALPRNVIERKKTGFGIPISRWLGAETAARPTTLNSRAWAKQVAVAYDIENAFDEVGLRRAPQ
jgi:asparagine synthase (glutamine-hydrolysing)